MGAPHRTEELAQPRRVDASALDQALADLFGRSDAERTQEEGQAMVRACGLTVIALAASDADLAEICARVGAATAVVPARTLMVQTAAREAGDQGISAEISAFCTLGPGGRQVCQEQVLLKATAARARDLPSLITPLPIPDLPVALYLAGTGLLASPVLPGLLPAADLLLVDSAGSPSLPAAFGALAGIEAEHGVAVRDLAYERLLPWREAVAAGFDRFGGARPRLDYVEAMCTELDPEMNLLLAWIASRLPAESRPEFAVVETSAEASAGQDVRRLRIGFADGRRRGTIDLRQLGRHVVEVDGERGDSPCSLPRPVPDDAEILVRLLSDPQGDRTYRDTLRAARERLAAP